MNGQRNYFLKKAHDLIKEAAPGKSVATNWKDRVISVNGDVGFRQSKVEVMGSFASGFSHLSLEQGPLGAAQQYLYKFSFPRFRS